MGRPKLSRPAQLSLILYPFPLPIILSRISTSVSYVPFLLSHGFPPLNPLSTSPNPWGNLANRIGEIKRSKKRCIFHGDRSFPISSRYSSPSLHKLDIYVGFGLGYKWNRVEEMLLGCHSSDFSCVVPVAFIGGAIRANWNLN